MLLTENGTRSRVPAVRAKPFPNSPAEKPRPARPLARKTLIPLKASTRRRSSEADGAGCGQFEFVAALRGGGASLEGRAGGRDQVGARHGIGIDHEKRIGARPARRLKAAAKRSAFAAQPLIVELDHARAGAAQPPSRLHPSSYAPQRK